MALPTIAINSAGSDTAASGAGPSSALSGTGASLASSTAVTLSVDNPDLSGVATDGSAALWVGTSSGRQWSKITAINNSTKVVTVETAYSVTESAKSWGIGGKRATLAGSTQLGLDVRGGWTIDVQSNQVLTANFRMAPNSVAGVWTAFTSTTTTRPVISTATNSVYGLDLQGANNLLVSHLSFLCTAATKGNGIAPAAATGASYVIVSDCVIDGFSIGIRDHDNGSNVDVNGLVVEGTEVKNCTSNGIDLWAGAQLARCYIHGNAGNGLAVVGARVRTINLARCVFDSNTSDQVSLAYQANIGILIDGCDFTNAPATRYGLSLNTTGGSTSLAIANSVFYGNGGGGLNAAGGNSLTQILRNNAFGANGVNVTNMVASTGAGAITLTASPFTSSSDFTPNSVAGGGALLRGAATTIPGATATAALDVGAVQSTPTAGPSYFSH